MISFNNNRPSDFDSDGDEDWDIDKFKKLIKEIISNGTSFGEGSYHEDLSLYQIEKIISYLMYSKNSSEIAIIIGKEPDEYHLNLTIQSIEK